MGIRGIRDPLPAGSIVANLGSMPAAPNPVSLTAMGKMLAQGGQVSPVITFPITPAQGGLGLSSGPSDAEILIGNSSGGYSLVTVSGGGSLSDAGILTVGTTPATWTPADASAGGLTLANISTTWQQVGNFIWLTAYFAYPSNSDTHNAEIGGFPVTFPNSNYGAPPLFFACTYTGAAVLLPNKNAKTANFYTAGVAGNVTNIQMSGAQVWINAFYPAS